MKKKTESKGRLVLTKETVRRLDATDLEQIRGGHCIYSSSATVQCVPTGNYFNTADCCNP